MQCFSFSFSPSCPRDMCADPFSLISGTSVASLITSPKYGAAKKANLYSYKIDVGGIPSEDCVLQALKQIVEKVKGRKRKPGYKGMYRDA